MTRKLHYAAVASPSIRAIADSARCDSGTDIFKAQTQNPKNRVGLDRVDNFISIDGVPMYKDHKLRADQRLQQPDEAECGFDGVDVHWPSTIRSLPRRRLRG